MRNLPFGLDFLLVLQTGEICLALAQGILYVEASGSEAECESADRCDIYEEQSLIAWYIWFSVSLFLAAILLCIAACCLQHWLKRRRLFSSQRTVAVFALSDADSGHSEFRERSSGERQSQRSAFLARKASPPPKLDIQPEPMQKKLGLSQAVCAYF
nr:transmembrane protein 207 [Zootoca vivipara]